MRILLTGEVLQHLDDRGESTLIAQRRTRDGQTPETFTLRFSQPEAFRDFRTRHAAGTAVQIVGLLRQVRTTLLDQATGQPLVSTAGKPLQQQVLAVEVREHRTHERTQADDTLYAHGLVGLVDKREGLKLSASGLPWLRIRVAYNHYKRPGEAEGQADYYDLVAFGQVAEGLATLDRGDRLLVDQAVPATSPYEARDVRHSDGTTVMRHGLELTVRDFTFLPRPRSGQREAPEAVPF
ncbi:MAG: hypothetical protein VKQ33_06570 [Candidatus Sericytochromatia bacterium]|nr:hypothetical protein [Candidatus Sericytochromatia bacterium]